MARLDLRLGQHVPFLHLDQYAYARNGARQTGNNLQLFVSTLWAASSVSLWRFVGPVMSYRERGTQPYRWHVKEVCHHGTAVDSGQFHDTLNGLVEGCFGVCFVRDRARGWIPLRV